MRIRIGYYCRWNGTCDNSSITTVYCREHFQNHTYFSNSWESDRLYLRITRQQMDSCHLSIRNVVSTFFVECCKVGTLQYISFNTSCPFRLCLDIKYTLKPPFHWCLLFHWCKVKKSVGWLLFLIFKQMRMQLIWYLTCYLNEKPCFLRVKAGKRICEEFLAYRARSLVPSFFSRPLRHALEERQQIYVWDY